MEKVYCVKTSEFNELANQHYISQDMFVENKHALELLASLQGHWLDREQAEKDESYLQVIPYCLVISTRFGFTDGTPTRSIFCYTRTKMQGERRLHGKKSIGVGGHINPCDVPTFAPSNGNPNDYREFTILSCARRELQEELNISPALSPLGLINYTKTPVGRVHVALVMLAEVPNLNDLHPAEKSMMDDCTQILITPDPRWLSSPQRRDFEDWSAVILDHLLFAE